MSSIPEGMSQDTFEYVIRFTVDHEGDTPFMYNNYPIKNPKYRDVTVGVGLALPNENAAGSGATNVAMVFTRLGTILIVINILLSPAR